MNLHICVLPVSFLLDLLLGDPRWLYHPICFLGKGISRLEKIMRKVGGCNNPGEHPVREVISGGMLALIMAVCSFGIPFAALYALEKRWPIVALILEIFWCWQLLATHSLKQESNKVYKELEKGDLPGARFAVSMIVGRDTDQLSQEGVVKATVETIAENASDGVAAPMFYQALLGVPGMFMYKAINTMDSMLGYKNDRYLYFGRCAARLDDVANFIPARLTAILMILGSFLVKMDGKNAWRIFWRDRKCHASPNSAQTESVAAGAMHLQLAGDAWYFGKLHKKPAIGDKDREIEPMDIPRMNRLMYAAAFLGMICFTLIRMGVIALL
ncbi:MAG: cobalamin biosynthesis protein CobD [Lachnospiraceae bacterium]|nr:cobalamin biosynthesis protein CobD [Lachnospiraceae bacterium]MCI9547019.1 cobalamin biosynthesis protein CobD [Lachnospiraceae bacterium]